MVALGQTLKSCLLYLKSTVFENIHSFTIKHLTKSLLFSPKKGDVGQMVTLGAHTDILSPVFEEEQTFCFLL